MTTEHISEPTDIDTFPKLVADHVAHGARFCGVFASASRTGTRLIAVLAQDGSLATEELLIPLGVTRYPSLSIRVPAAAWYEREILDLFGLEPSGHPRLESLVFPFPVDAERPRPGLSTSLGRVDPDLSPLASHVQGEGVFTIPYGPVRSGVFESIEYVVETSGEDILHLGTRVFHKHRGVETRFEGMDPADGVLLAERCEGVASVAHALAFCGAIEQLANIDIPIQANMVRVLHGELERVANHLESTIRHTEAAGQAVAFSRLSLHKERIQQLRSRLCGNRFGRGVVVPGGVSGPPNLNAQEIFSMVDSLETAIRADTRLLLATPSFIDRLRGTGVLTPEIAKEYGAVGPVGRASGLMEDVRYARPYAGYERLGHILLETRSAGDALARQQVRLDEIRGAFHLIRQSVDMLNELPHLEPNEWHVPIAEISGRGLGWAEAPQGEVLYLVEVSNGRLVRVKPRSASFHNLALFSMAFPKDILTDFAFIEASFGLSVAGVAS